MTPTALARSDAFVCFGATGDLAFKQIFPALAELVRSGRLDMPIVAVGRKAMSTDELLARVSESLKHSGDEDASTFEALARHLRYVVVDYDDPATFARIRQAIGDASHPLHYIALPPEIFEKVACEIATAGLAAGARIALEKPFGRDPASAKELSRALHRSFPEESIFRVDHYLGKEPVENIAYFRAANPLIEASFNANFVESIQITMAETMGVEGRAAFYDSVGAVRDVIQSHALEVVACLAMELPSAAGHAALRDERSRLLAHMNALSTADIVRGQVRTYHDEKGVADASTTETFAALRLTIDLPRWRDVPIFVRAGKFLRITATEATVRWKASCHPTMDERSPPASNHVRFRIGPDATIGLGVNVKTAGQAMVGEREELILHRQPPHAMKPYERLLGDAIDGDPTLFARKDAVEEAWRVVAPVLDDATPVYPYEPGSWGPEEANRIRPPGGWAEPP